MSRKLKVVVIFTGWLLGGCRDIPPLECVDDSVCGTKNPGVCVLSQGIGGACGVPDETCPSGYRYYKDSSHGRGNECAVLPTFDVSSEVTMTEEHKMFKVHVTARDGAGAKFLDYRRMPVLSADWGDVRQFSATPFVSGEADFSIWLNRETNPTDGPLHVIAKDGAMYGRSQEITVTTPAWVAAPDLYPPGEFQIDQKKYGIPIFIPRAEDFALWFIYVANGIEGKEIRLDTRSSVPNTNWSSSETVFSVDPKNSIFSFNVIFTGELYQMIYHLSNGGSGEDHILESVDGKKWTTQRDKRLDADTGDSDCTSLFVNGSQSGGLLYTEGFTFEGGNSYRIFYTNLNKGRYIRCSAVSEDGGLTWAQAAKIVWPVGVRSYDFVSIVKDQTTYHGWVAGGSDTKNFHATSADGIHWVLGTGDATAPKYMTVSWSEKDKRFIGIQFEKLGDKYQFFSRP